MEKKLGFFHCCGSAVVQPHVITFLWSCKIIDSSKRFILENENGIFKFLIINTKKYLNNSSTSVILKNDNV